MTQPANFQMNQMNMFGQNVSTTPTATKRGDASNKYDHRSNNLFICLAVRSSQQSRGALF